MNKLAKVNAMSGQERRWLLQAWSLLPLVRLLLRLLGLRRTQALMIRFAGNLVETELEIGQARDIAKNIARLVISAARYHLISANCLPQSLVLWWLLRRNAIDSELRIGVRKQHGNFEAHAWVEVFGMALENQASEEQRFAPFEASIRPPEVRLP
ncbi:MAG: lasso peptide biosynthesis B2 protein [Acidobacteria bacterium]|nr:lasso peptide biosynthesis B2 protein [Acidobacteriota bacterium]